MGLYVVVSDGNKDAPGFAYADHKIVVSTYDIENTVTQAENYHNNIGKLDGVMCIASDVPSTVASVSEALGLPGISVRSAEIAMDKLAMKECFLEHNINCPKFKTVRNFNELLSLVDDWGYPLILKPTDNRGARGVLRLTQGIDLKWAFQHSFDNSPRKKVIVEKFLNGIQLSTESMLVEGRAYTPGIAERNYEYIERFDPYIIENGSDQPADLSGSEKEDINRLIEQGAQSMGIENGIIKGDLVIHEGKIYIIELAARLSGGYFSTHMIPLNSGVDLVEQNIKFAIGETVVEKDLLPKFNLPICQRYFFPDQGQIKSIEGLKKVNSKPSTKFLSVWLGEGDIIPEQTSHVSRAGMLICSGSTKENAIEEAKNSIASVRFNMH